MNSGKRWYFNYIPAEEEGICMMKEMGDEREHTYPLHDPGLGTLGCFFDSMDVTNEKGIFKFVFYQTKEGDLNTRMNSISNTATEYKGTVIVLTNRPNLSNSSKIKSDDPAKSKSKPKKRKEKEEKKKDDQQPDPKKARKKQRKSPAKPKPEMSQLSDQGDKSVSSDAKTQ